MRNVISVLQLARVESVKAAGLVLVVAGLGVTGRTWWVKTSGGQVYWLPRELWMWGRQTLDAVGEGTFKLPSVVEFKMLGRLVLAVPLSVPTKEPGMHLGCEAAGTCWCLRVPGAYVEHVMS